MISDEDLYMLIDLKLTNIYYVIGLPEGPTTQNLPTYCRCITKDSECDGFIVKDLNPKKLDLRIVNNVSFG